LLHKFICILSYIRVLNLCRFLFRIINLLFNPLLKFMILVMVLEFRFLRNVSILSLLLFRRSMEELLPSTFLEYMGTNILKPLIFSLFIQQKNRKLISFLYNWEYLIKINGMLIQILWSLCMICQSFNLNIFKIIARDLKNWLQT
jgi:hypothetical protein